VTTLFPVRLAGAVMRQRGHNLVGPIDLDLSGDGTTVIVGPNGAGKTSLLRLMHGLGRLRGGSLNWACPAEEARRHQAFVFQTPIIMRRSVRDNIAYPLVLRGIARAAAKEEASALANRVGLSQVLDRPALGISGGEKQKLALARALITKPAVLFLDEPCASLDGRATREIEDILLDQTEMGTRLIMTTHNMGQARRLAHEIVFLLHGRVHEFGPAASVLDSPTTPECAAFLRGDIVE